MQLYVDCNNDLIFPGKQTILQFLAKMGAVRTDDHFVYKSGKHGNTYINKDAVSLYTENVRALCHVLALRVADLQIEAVIAPAIGGVILSFQMAQELTIHNTKGRQIFCTYAEKVGDDFVIRRGFDKILNGKQVLVVEDVLTTGGSAAKVVQTVRAVGGMPIAVAALCNRGGVTPEVLGVSRLDTLINVQLDMWDEADCPLCAQGVPVNTDLGHGREFLARKQQLA